MKKQVPRPERATCGSATDLLQARVPGSRRLGALVGAVLTVLMLLTVPVPDGFAFDPGKLNKISFENGTGTKIDLIFVTPADSKFWGPDLIGADYYLNVGETISYYVYYPDPSFGFDMKGTDDNRNSCDIRDFEVIDGKEVRVTLKSESFVTPAPDTTLATVHIENRTGHEILYLFVSPPDSKAWGVDLLDEETTVADGRSHSFVLSVGRERLVYNLMGVDENNDEYRFDIAIDANAKKTYTWAIEPRDLTPAK